MKPRVIQAKHARNGTAWRNWKVQYNGREYVYSSWYWAMRAANRLATRAGSIPVRGLLSMQHIQ